jgi:hypothetical protein
MCLYLSVDNVEHDHDLANGVAKKGILSQN